MLETRPIGCHPHLNYDFADRCRDPTSDNVVLPWTAPSASRLRAAEVFGILHSLSCFRAFGASFGSITLSFNSWSTHSLDHKKTDEGRSRKEGAHRIKNSTSSICRRWKYISIALKQKALHAWISIEKVRLKSSVDTIGRVTLIHSLYGRDSTVSTFPSLMCVLSEADCIATNVFIYIRALHYRFNYLLTCSGRCISSFCFDWDVRHAWKSFFLNFCVYFWEIYNFLNPLISDGAQEYTPS